jgi:RsiW-degrading membrane proteinase PrsW (M82 family)
MAVVGRATAAVVKGFAIREVAATTISPNATNHHYHSTTTIVSNVARFTTAVSIFHHRRHHLQLSNYVFTSIATTFSKLGASMLMFKHSFVSRVPLASPSSISSAKTLAPLASRFFQQALKEGGHECTTLTIDTFFHCL